MSSISLPEPIPAILQRLNELFKTFPWASAIISGLIAGIILTLILKNDRCFFIFNGTSELGFPSIFLAVSTVALVLVTFHYAKTTAKISEESRKERKADYIQNQLEKFYTPLITNEQFWHSDYKRFFNARTTVNPSNEQDKLIKEFLDVYRRYKHFASTNLESSMSQLEDFTWSGTPDAMDIVEKETHWREYNEFKEEFSEILKEDYKRLQEELETLLLKKEDKT